MALKHPQGAVWVVWLASAVGSVSLLHAEEPPDSDGDGIADTADECPSEPGAAVMNGCPCFMDEGAVDSDCDGIPDSEDGYNDYGGGDSPGDGSGGSGESGGGTPGGGTPGGGAPPSGGTTDEECARMRAAFEADRTACKKRATNRALECAIGADFFRQIICARNKIADDKKCDEDYEALVASLPAGC